MPKETKFGRLFMPYDGEDHPPDGVTGPLETVSQSENWADTLQTDLDRIEEMSPMVDAVANRPPASEGLTLFYATDEEVLYYNAGASWVSHPGPTSATPDSLSVGNWDLVDVTNEGYDGTGSKDLQDVFDTYGTNTTYILPKGTYRLDGIIKDVGDFEHVAFIGRPHATIDVATNDFEKTFFLGASNANAENIVLQNLTVDITGTDPSDGADIDRGLFYGLCTNSIIVDNVELVGARHRWQDPDGDGTYQSYGDLETVLPVCLNEEATALVSRLRMPDGGTYEPDASASVGHAIGVAGGGPTNKGTTTIRDSSVAGFVDNGFYLRNEDNRVFLINCVAKNCNNSNIRVGRDDVVLNCRSIHDVDDGMLGVGLYVQNADNCLIENFRLDISAPVNDIVRVKETEQATLRNFKINCSSSDRCDIEPDASGEQILLENWRVDDTAPGDEQNTTLRVTGAGATIRDSTFLVDNRNAIRCEGGDTYVENCYFDTPGSSGHGVLVGTPDGGDAATVPSVSFHRCEFANSPFYLYSDDTVGNWAVSWCDFTAVSGAPDADVHGTVTEWHRFENQGWSPSQVGAIGTDTLEVPIGTQVRPFANTGEYVLLDVAGQGGGSKSTTSTTYSMVEGNDVNGRMVSAGVGAADYANINNIWVSFAVVLRNNTAGETTYARLRDLDAGQSLSGTETSMTGTTSTVVHSPRVQYSPGLTYWAIEAKVTAGTGIIQANPVVYIWGEVA